MKVIRKISNGFPKCPDCKQYKLFLFEVNDKNNLIMKCRNCECAVEVKE